MFTALLIINNKWQLLLLLSFYDSAFLTKCLSTSLSSFCLLSVCISSVCPLPVHTYLPLISTILQKCNIQILCFFECLPHVRTSDFCNLFKVRRVMDAIIIISKEYVGKVDSHGNRTRAFMNRSRHSTNAPRCLIACFTSDHQTLYSIQGQTCHRMD